MKIFLRNSSGQDTELADEPIFDRRISGQITLQIEEILRSNHVKLFPRGNKKNNFAFQTKHSHASLAAATLFAHRRYPTLETQGDVLIVEYDSLNQPIVVITYTNAVVYAHEVPLQEGLVTYHQYAVIGEQVVFNSLNYLEEDSEMLIHGSVTVPIGQNYVDVAVPGLSVIPLRVYVTLHIPTGAADKIFADVVKDTIDTAGFRVALSGIAAVADFQIDYLIIPGTP